MELELGLALPTTTIRGFDFDLNCSTYEVPVNNKKRCFTDDNRSLIVGQRGSVPRTLPLLVWNNHPNEEEEEDPDNNILRRRASSDDIDGEVIVGWPPVKSMWRKNKNKNKKKKNNNNNKWTVEIDSCSSTASNSNSMFVKVKMDGLAIARKIDVTLYDSFEQLKETLINMFGKCRDESDYYKLSYQNSEGDWLHAQDVSWRTFIRSVQRLKLSKSNA